VTEAEPFAADWVFISRAPHTADELRRSPIRTTMNIFRVFIIPPY
jgi:hypothetical protein